jgi:hypothetical protein
MLLKLPRMIHGGTQDPLHDIGLGAVVGRMFTPKVMFIIIVVCKIICIVSLKC